MDCLPSSCEDGGGGPVVSEMASKGPDASCADASRLRGRRGARPSLDFSWAYFSSSGSGWLGGVAQREMISEVMSRLMGAASCEPW